MLNRTLLERYHEVALRWLERRPTQSTEWQDAAWFGDFLLYVTAEELRLLGRQIEELVAPYQQRVFHPEERPDGARTLSMLHMAIPYEEERHPQGDST